MVNIPRRLQAAIEFALAEQSAVGLLGPRQVGKTTLAHCIAASRDAAYLDLENPEDLALLSEPRPLLAGYAGKLVILDEVQRLPGLFQTLRGLIDEHRRTGRGTASGCGLRDAPRHWRWWRPGRARPLAVTRAYRHKQPPLQEAAQFEFPKVSL